MCSFFLPFYTFSSVFVLLFTFRIYIVILVQLASCIDMRLSIQTLMSVCVGVQVKVRKKNRRNWKFFFRFDYHYIIILFSISGVYYYHDVLRRTTWLEEFYTSTTNASMWWRCYRTQRKEKIFSVDNFLMVVLFSLLHFSPQLALTLSNLYLLLLFNFHSFHSNSLSSGRTPFSFALYIGSYMGSVDHECISS